MSIWRRLLDDEAREHPRKTRALLGLLLAFNVAAWAAALWLFQDAPLLLGMAVVAYGFGLRHAVDADHIAAIDNVTRKLMQEGRHPLGAGLMFSLGHSTVVVLATLGVVGLTLTFRQHFDGWREVGSVIGTAFSSLFLLAIAAINWPALQASYRDLRRGGMQAPSGSGSPVAGPLARLLAPLFKRVTRSGHMYPLGLLFGLTFDTATEIALLGFAAGETTHGLPVWSILAFPLLFTAGMTLIDSANGVLMLRAYGWGFVQPARRARYNFTITLVSVATALIIGGVGGLGLLASQLHFGGFFWDAVSTLSRNLNSLGLVLIALFAFAWGIARGIDKARRFYGLEPEASRSD